MRLLLIQPEYPPAVGGMQTHAAALARGLHERGHRLAVVTYAHPDDPGAAARFDAAQPFPIHRCLSRLSYWANLTRLRSLAAEVRPDLVYSSTPFYGLLGAAAGIPVVCRSVGNDVMRCWIPYPFRPASGLIARPLVERRLERLYRGLGAPAWLEDILLAERRQLVRRAAHAASAILANSHYTRDRLIELGVDPAAITVVPGGVDAARFALVAGAAARGDGAGPILLTVGRLVAKKGLDVLLPAVARARGEVPGLRLRVVGDGPERGKCQALARHLGLDGAVHFVGRVPHDEIAGYYQTADCFVLASRVHRRRNGWADVETMGRVICEANAAGLPVVATATGGVPSLVTHERNGLLVPPDDPDALAAASVRLCRSPELRATLRREGLRRARHEFDWSVVVDAYQQAFERARASAGAPEASGASPVGHASIP